MERKLIFNAPPSHVPCNTTPDGAYTGNGDLGVIWGGNGENIKLYISKVDFWNAKEGDKQGGIRSLGFLEFRFPQLKGASFRVEQDLNTAVLSGVFENKDSMVNMRVCVCAEKNFILIDVVQRGAMSEPEAEFHLSYGENIDEKYGLASVSYGTHEDMKWARKGYSWNDFRFSSRSIMVLKRVGVKATEAGIHSQYVLRVATNHDMSNYDTVALNEASKANAELFKEMLELHREWWKNFWNKSSVSLDDKEVELNWYAGQYAMACCSRNKKFPPGLYGNFITNDTPAWGGDYHLNYNYEAPFYALASSNHVELTEGYETPLLEFMDNAKENARDHCRCRGAYYDVGIGPKGMNTSFMPDAGEKGHLFLGQKSNGLYACIVPVMKWYSTYDNDYALERAYPLLREVVTFWEDYLHFEEGRYVVYNDAVHEVPYYIKNFDPHGKNSYANDFNPILTLGLLRTVVKCALDMSKELGIDADRRKKWDDILENLSRFPIQKKRGKIVFRYTERGQDWCKGNTLGIQHIYPAGTIGLGSSEKTLGIARNTFNLMNRWDDSNGFSSYYPCAARLGVSPDKILNSLHKIYKTRQYPNLLFSYGGGCLENAAATSNTVNEMLMQSYDGIVRLFPCWDKMREASFCNLRAYGAFLVSAKARNGKAENVTVVSEKGRVLRIENPYDRADVIINGRIVMSTGACLIQTKTVCGDVIEIKEI